MLGRLADAEPPRLGRQRGQALEDVLLGLLAHPFEVADLAGLGGRLQLLQVLDLHLLVEDLDAFGAQALDAQEVRQVRRQLLTQVLQRAAGAGLQDFVDLLGQALADAGEFLKVLAGGRQVGQALGHVAHGPRCVTVGADAEGVLALDFQDVGDLVEDGGDLAVFQNDPLRHKGVVNRKERKERKGKAELKQKRNNEEFFCFYPILPLRSLHSSRLEKPCLITSSAQAAGGVKSVMRSFQGPRPAAAQLYPRRQNAQELSMPRRLDGNPVLK